MAIKQAGRQIIKGISNIAEPHAKVKVIAVSCGDGDCLRNPYP